MISRSGTTKQIPINVVGSSTFGRYPKISIEKTYNMLISDNFLVPFPGYNIAILASKFRKGGLGRGIHVSTQLGRMICVIGSTVYSVNIFYDQDLSMSIDSTVTILNPSLPLSSSTGTVYIAENNVPQIAICDGINVYVYDPNNVNGTTFYVMTGDGAGPSSDESLHFTPIFVDYHDNYFHIAALHNTNYSPTANFTWRITSTNGTTGQVFVDETGTAEQAANTGQIQTKSDEIQAVVRAPSKGNMIWVMGKTVTEAWYDQGLQIFPYARSTAYNIDYGCLSPATIARLDEIVVWLGANEQSGPIILYTTGGEPQKITTDGIDYLFSQLTDPSDSEAFLMRQNGHLIYVINFITDNLSLFYDFNTQKFFHCCDQNLNYYLASKVAFFNNAYYFLSQQNGNLYNMSTEIVTYTTTDNNNNVVTYEIPRIRTCKSVRTGNQEYFIANDIGFTIESGEIPFQQQDGGPIFLIDQSNTYLLISQGEPFLLETQSEVLLVTQDGNNLGTQQVDPTDYDNLIAQNDAVIYTLPRVDLSISIDGGASFSSDFAYNLNPPAHRKNKLLWWQLGIANDFTPQFKFWGLGRFVATDGVLNIRQ